MSVHHFCQLPCIFYLFWLPSLVRDKVPSDAWTSWVGIQPLPLPHSNISSAPSDVRSPCACSVTAPFVLGSGPLPFTAINLPLLCNVSQTLHHLFFPSPNRVLWGICSAPHYISVSSLLVDFLFIVDTRWRLEGKEEGHGICFFLFSCCSCLQWPSSGVLLLQLRMFWCLCPVSCCTSSTRFRYTRRSRTEQPSSGV